MIEALNWKQIERFFLSRRVAVLLLITTFALLILSVRLRGAAELTSSPFFQILPLLIFASTLLCTLSRLKARRSRAQGPRSYNIFKNAPIGGKWQVGNAESTLLKMGWKKVEGRDGCIVAAKGGSGFWGSIVFHAGILLMLTAGAMTFFTSFGGEVLLTQGLPTPLGREGLLKIWREPLWPVTMPDGEVTLEKFDAVYEDERFPVDYVARVKIEDRNGLRFVNTGVNDPLILGQLQYTLDSYGFAPGFLIKDGTGKVVFDGYVSLVLLDGTEDHFEIPGTGGTLYVRFFPDFVKGNGKAATRSRMLKNPVLGLRMEKGGMESERGKLVRLGDTAEIGGFEISPYEVRYWVHFGVARDFGRPVILVSIILMAGGLVVRFLYYERWLRVERTGNDAMVSGYSRYFPALFEGEVERITDEIGREK